MLQWYLKVPARLKVNVKVLFGVRKLGVSNTPVSLETVWGATVTFFQTTTSPTLMVILDG